MSVVGASLLTAQIFGSAYEGGGRHRPRRQRGVLRVRAPCPINLGLWVAAPAGTSASPCRAHLRVRALPLPDLSQSPRGGFQPLPDVHPRSGDRRGRACKLGKLAWISSALLRTLRIPCAGGKLQPRWRGGVRNLARKLRRHRDVHAPVRELDRPSRTVAGAPRWATVQREPSGRLALATPSAKSLLLMQGQCSWPPS